jgi:hypothetical protein
MKKLPLLIISVFLLSGCATQSFLIQDQPSKISEEKSSHFFVAGVFQTDEVDASAICGGADKVAKVETKLSVVNGFLSLISYGIYTPRQKTVYCVR